MGFFRINGQDHRLILCPIPIDSLTDFESYANFIERNILGQRLFQPFNFLNLKLSKYQTRHYLSTVLLV